MAALDCERKSVEMLSVELERFFSDRGGLGLEPTGEADVEVPVGTVDDAAEIEEGFDVKSVKLAMIAGVIVDMLLCCWRCCGRDITLKDDVGGR